MWRRGRRGARAEGSPRRLVAAGTDVAPVVDRVAHRLVAAGAVGERRLTVVDLAAGGVLLDVVPVAEHVLVLELGRLVAVQGDRPMGRVDASQSSCARIPRGARRG